VQGYDLPVQVGGLYMVKIDQNQMPNAAAGQGFGATASNTPNTKNRHGAVLKHADALFPQQRLCS